MCLNIQINIALLSVTLDITNIDKHFPDKEGHVWVCDSVRSKKGIKQHREKDFACFRSCTPGFYSLF